MPKVPFSNPQPRAQAPAPNIDPTALAMAAAMMVEEGRIVPVMHMDALRRYGPPPLRGATKEYLKRIERQFEAMDEVNGPGEAMHPSIIKREGQNL